jgi:hypothetical protein
MKALLFLCDACQRSARSMASHSTFSCPHKGITLIRDGDRTYIQFRGGEHRNGGKSHGDWFNNLSFR